MKGEAKPCLEKGGKKQILAEMSPVLGFSGHTILSGRVVREKLDFSRMDVVPKQDIRIDERKRGRVQLQAKMTDEQSFDLGTFNIDREGWISARVNTPLPIGEYEIQASFRDCLIGTTSMRILHEDYDSVVVRSDVDMTYLKTDFHTTSAMLELLEQPADKREALPGMPRIYQLLRDRSNVNRPLSFISGSPTFFARVLQNKMKLDGVLYDEIVLKPFKDLLVHGGLNPIGLLKEQVGYKLEALLRLRQNIPPQSKEVLMGDDTEADPIVYALYTKLVQRKMNEEELYKELKKLKVSRFWRKKIQKQLPFFYSSLGDRATVIQIYIHQTKEESQEFDEWKQGVPIRFHRNAEELEVDLRGRDWMKTSSSP
jgi:hypothetical protein